MFKGRFKGLYARLPAKLYASPPTNPKNPVTPITTAAISPGLSFFVLSSFPTIAERIFVDGLLVG